MGSRISGTSPTSSYSRETTEDLSTGRTRHVGVTPKGEARKKKGGSPVVHTPTQRAAVRTDTRTARKAVDTAKSFLASDPNNLTLQVAVRGAEDEYRRADGAAPKTAAQSKVLAKAYLDVAVREAGKVRHWSMPRPRRC